MVRARNHYITLRPCACLPRREYSPRGQWRSEKEPQKFVHLWLDICASGLWGSDGTEGIVDDLPISDALITAIERWQQDYDDSWNMMTKAAEGGPPEYEAAYPHDWFDARGAALAAALRAELGPEWEITHKPLMRPADFRKSRWERM
jgi:hypothetical protein